MTRREYALGVLRGLDELYKSVSRLIGSPADARTLQMVLYTCRMVLDCGIRQGWLPDHAEEDLKFTVRFDGGSVVVNVEPVGWYGNVIKEEVADELHEREMMDLEQELEPS